MYVNTYICMYKNTHMYSHRHTQFVLKYLQQAVDSDHPWEEE